MKKNKPHFWFDIQSRDRIIDHIRLAPHRMIHVVSQKMQKLPDGKQDIWHRCKFFYDEPDAESYWNNIKLLHEQGRVRVLRTGQLVGGWGCPPQMQQMQ